MTGDQRPTDPITTLHQRLDVDFALQAAGLGVWELDPATRQVIWDDRCRQLFGLAKDNLLPYDQAIQYIHPDDVEQVDQAVTRALNPRSDGRFDQTYRTIGADDKQLRWVRFQGQARFSPTGELIRYAGIAQDVTPQVLLQQQQQQVLAQFEQAPVGIATISGPELTIRSANPAYCQVIGRSPDQFVGKTLLEAIPESEGQGFDALMRQVMATGQPYTAQEVPAQMIRPGQSDIGYYSFTYEPQRATDGTIGGVLVVVIEVTQQVQARQQLYDIIQQTPAPTLVLRGDEYRIDQINQPMLNFMGRGEEVRGQPLLAIMPELAGQFAWQQVQQVYQEGIDFEQAEVLVPHVRNGILQDMYYDISYRPLREAGTIVGMIQVAIDVTEQVTNRQRVEASERKLQGLIAAAPVAIGLLMGRDLVIENPNQTFIDIAGKGPAIEGIPLRQAMPELVTYGQQFLDILDAMFTTGVPFNSPASLAKIVQDGVLTEKYYNISYFPIRNAAGAVYALVNMSVEVTQEVLLRQQIEQTSAGLQSAIELAELGTFSMDIATGLVTVSPRTAEWFGFENLVADAESFIASIGEAEREAVRTSMNETLRADSDGRFDVSHSVINTKTGRRTIIHSVGQLYFDAAGQPIKIEGTAQDITVQQELQAVLEQQVQQRTEELAAASEELAVINEELAASNEEYAAMNEELSATNEELAVTNEDFTTANRDLIRSNQSLEQFAYIASHDLQEPLRKIQQFGDLLQGQYGDVLGEGASYLQRMQVAASRMSILIKDLLTFSRIAATQVTAAPVALNEVVNRVLESLSVAVEESEAQISIDDLPTVQGDMQQLTQLFQNLLSNALKFRRTTTEGHLVTPQITVRSRQLAKQELPTWVKPMRDAKQYHLIEVIDNGIGFNEKYLDRIFQVFQRLHGKNEFAGTGVGLAIVQKVVTNHGGAITASSAVNQGATFYVYLPG